MSQCWHGNKPAAPNHEQLGHNTASREDSARLDVVVRIRAVYAWMYLFYFYRLISRRDRTAMIVSSPRGRSEAFEG